MTAMAIHAYRCIEIAPLTDPDVRAVSDHLELRLVATATAFVDVQCHLSVVGIG
jgi:hypothetical protein